MEKSTFIFIVEAEQELTVVGRIVAMLSRNQVLLRHMTLDIQGSNALFQITLELHENKDNVNKLSRRFEKEIDIHTVNFFEKN